MAEHGTRTMYVHYGCRCDECCKAEHRQYLKRSEAKGRSRTFSKWGTDEIPAPVKRESQRRSDANRYKILGERSFTHTHQIRWTEIAERFDMKCAICGCDVNQNDFWINEKGRKCFGRAYPTVDHIIPLKCGGTDSFDNVQLTCKHCNSKKGARYEQTGQINKTA